MAVFSKWFELLTSIVLGGWCFPFSTEEGVKKENVFIQKQLYKLAHLSDYNTTRLLFKWHFCKNKEQKRNPKARNNKKYKTTIVHPLRAEFTLQEQISCWQIFRDIQNQEKNAKQIPKCPGLCYMNREVLANGALWYYLWLSIIDHSIISLNRMHLLGKVFIFKTAFGSLSRSPQYLRASEQNSRIAPSAPNTPLL